MQWSPQILHCNDWHTAFAPLFLKALLRLGRAVRRHALGADDSQHRLPGRISAQRPSSDLALGTKSYLLHQDDLRAGRINPLRARHHVRGRDHDGQPDARAGDLHRPVRHGPAGFLRARGDALTGILNGVDYDDWDPRHDRFLPQHFDPEHLE